jgi:hypothetical protein
MKSNALTISSALAAIAAIVILPVSTVAAGIIFVVTGILAIFVADYGRTIKPLSLRAEIIPFNSTDRVLDSLSAAA